MKIGELIKKGKKLYRDGNYTETIPIFEEILKQEVNDKERKEILYLLGGSYFLKKDYNKAVEYFSELLDFAQEKGDTNYQYKALDDIGYCYFGKENYDQAIDYFKKLLALSEKENNVEYQYKALDDIGYCYFSKENYDPAIDYFKELLALSEKENNVEYQCRALYNLGGIYFNKENYDPAIDYFKKLLALSEKENNVEYQCRASYNLGGIYFNKENYDQAIKYFTKKLTLVQEQENTLEELDALYWISLNCFLSGDQQETASKNFEKFKKLYDELQEEDSKEYWKKRIKNLYFLNKEYDVYLKEKKEIVSRDLFNEEVQDESLEDYIATIFSVLHIEHLELGDTPLAHYASPLVCEKLFGLDDKNSNSTDIEKRVVHPSPMRMGSFTYMNDPTEGKSLLDVLGQQDLELDNKIALPQNNAFFACFSTRINDLNQFRLYGKEDGVEASGCCLVFNKDGKWLGESKLSSSYTPLLARRVNNEQEENSKKVTLDVDNKNQPLYQVAYIAYLDEYTKKNKCSFSLSLKGREFGIYLNSSWNEKWGEEWNKIREKKLKEALHSLIDYFDQLNGDEKARGNALGSLEYIRFLFKDFAFRDEEEFRLMRIADVASQEIKYCEATQSIYIDYRDITDIVNEVILGTNYEKTNRKRKVEVFRHQMRKFENITISHSALPINANMPCQK